MMRLGREKQRNKISSVTYAHPHVDTLHSGLRTGFGLHYEALHKF